MIIPVACFHCGRREPGAKWLHYVQLIRDENKTEKQALEILGIHQCCARTMRYHIEGIDIVIVAEELDETPLPSQWQPEKFSYNVKQVTPERMDIDSLATVASNANRAAQDAMTLVRSLNTILVLIPPITVKQEPVS